MALSPVEPQDDCMYTHKNDTIMVHNMYMYGPTACISLEQTSPACKLARGGRGWGGVGGGST